jgi:hypothetical protein
LLPPKDKPHRPRCVDSCRANRTKGSEEVWRIGTDGSRAKGKVFAIQTLQTQDPIHSRLIPSKLLLVPKDIETQVLRGASLEATIRHTLSKPTGDITRGDIAGLTGLHEHDDGPKVVPIRDLTGLEHATNLQDLGLNYNNIEDLSPLSNLTNLRSLSLRSGSATWNINTVADISPLTNLTKLVRLDLGGNRVADISPLTNLARLESLILRGNQVADIYHLKNLNSLRELDLWSNSFSDLFPLSELTSLERLSLGRLFPDPTKGPMLQVTDMSFLADFENLTYLDLSSTRMEDLSVIPDLPKLETLRIDENPLADLSGISRFTSLKQSVDIGDVDGDGINEIIVAAESSGSQCEGLRGLSVWKYQPEYVYGGTVIEEGGYFFRAWEDEKTRRYGGYPVVNGMLALRVLNIDGDGRQEIVGIGGSTLYLARVDDWVYDSDKQALWEGYGYGSTMDAWSVKAGPEPIAASMVAIAVLGVLMTRREQDQVNHVPLFLISHTSRQRAEPGLCRRPRPATDSSQAICDV